MAIRQIILDTETTGLNVQEGHRMIEIGALEMIDRKLTGRTFHYYMNPLREIEAGAVAVHGITNDFLQDKPVFSSLAHELVEFIAGSELIIHNAPFDISFLDYELSLCAKGFKRVADYCRVLDTLILARQIHVGQRNSLDALCKRYGVDNAKREYHGALLDAHLLAQVYLAMTGGQGSFFDQAQSRSDESRAEDEQASVLNPHKINVISASAEELVEHEKYLNQLAAKGKCLWRIEEIN
jgi:DNA polymerase III subunit epsilon